MILMIVSIIFLYFHYSIYAVLKYFPKFYIKCQLISCSISGPGAYNLICHSSRKLKVKKIKVPSSMLATVLIKVAMEKGSCRHVSCCNTTCCILFINIDRKIILAAHLQVNKQSSSIPLRVKGVQQYTSRVKGVQQYTSRVKDISLVKL